MTTQLPITFSQFAMMVKEKKDESVTDVNLALNVTNELGYSHKEDGPAKIYSDGSTEWYNCGLLHRDGGPAVEKANGEKIWYFNGQKHRIGGPAHIAPDGSKFWIVKDQFHREDGPAIEMIDGNKSWFLFGQKVDEKKYNWLLLDKELRNNRYSHHIKSECRPFGRELHNVAGPAREWMDGLKEYFVNGKRHRENGPAVILPNKEEYYYLYDALFDSKEAYEHRIQILKTDNPMPISDISNSQEKENVDLPSKSKKSDKNKINQWPDDPSTLVDYDDIYKPLKDILEEGYKLTRKLGVNKFDYSGYDIGKIEKRLFPAIKDQLSEKFLAKEKEQNNKTLMDVVMRLMFLMGIEQGRRMSVQEYAPLKSMEKALSSYRDRNKKLRYNLDQCKAIIEILKLHPNIEKDELNKLISIEMEKTRKLRLEEIKNEIKIDPNINCFRTSKLKKKIKMSELLYLAHTLDQEIVKMSDWINILSEAGCSLSEWKNFCKKNKFNKFIKD